MRGAFGFALICLFASSFATHQAPQALQVRQIEACSAGLTEAGRGSSFQGTAILQAETDGDGAVLAVKDLRVPEVFPIFIQLAEFRACVKRWKFSGAGAAVVTFTAGTTGETLRAWRMSVGSAGQSLEVVLPRD